jgi:predicted transcriptional regulator
VMDKNLDYIDINTQLEKVIERVYEKKASVLIVTENEQLAGILDADNLSEFILINSIKAKQSQTNEY